MNSCLSFYKQIHCFNTTVMSGEITISLWLEGVGLHLTEFAWLVSCSIITDHYSFQCLKEMFFGYFHVVGV